MYTSSFITQRYLERRLKLQPGTSPDICNKIIFPDLYHRDAVMPGMIEGIRFIMDLTGK
jgi:hypothetical protein